MSNKPGIETVPLSAPWAGIINPSPHSSWLNHHSLKFLLMQSHSQSVRIDSRDENICHFNLRQTTFLADVGLGCRVGFCYTTLSGALPTAQPNTISPRATLGQGGHPSPPSPDAVTPVPPYTWLQETRCPPDCFSRDPK